MAHRPAQPSLSPDEARCTTRQLRTLLIVAWPVLAILGLVAWSQWRIARLGLGDPNSVRWGQGDALLRVSSYERSDGETLQISAAVVDTTGRRLLEETLGVNRDMFGGGLAAALQADDDPELEVVVWGAHEASRAFFFDYADGRATRRPFAEASQKAQATIASWRQANVSADTTLVLVVLLALAYWVLLFLVWLLGKLLRRPSAARAPAAGGGPA